MKNKFLSLFIVACLVTILFYPVSVRAEVNKTQGHLNNREQILYENSSTILTTEVVDGAEIIRTYSNNELVDVSEVSYENSIANSLRHTASPSATKTYKGKINYTIHPYAGTPFTTNCTCYYTQKTYTGQTYTMNASWKPLSTVVSGIIGAFGLPASVAAALLLLFWRI